MSLSAKELKAIHWYCQQYGLRPELSSVPTMYFKEKISLLLCWSTVNGKTKRRR